MTNLMPPSPLSHALSTLPQVSLISSWFVPPQDQWTVQDDLPALRHALEQQILLHDLYFLHPADLAWYAAVAGMQGPGTESPLEFVAKLTASQLDLIAAALTRFLADHYHGRLIGPRPRFTALATYWPSINAPGPDSKGTGRNRREWSVKAVRNSLYLAMKLGCHRVEIVGGSALPDDHEAAQHPDKAIQQRRTTLVQSLVEVFTGPDADKLFGENTPPDRRPKLCMEIEPGVCFLLKDIASFKVLHQELRLASEEVAAQVLLNIDVAHMMLTEGNATCSGAELQLAQLQEVKKLIGHMHISDHARSHASDLTPGTYHFYTDFDPWLKLAVELTHQPHPYFSTVVAVEMEACADIHEAARAIGRTRRWIQHASKECIPSRLPEHEAQLSAGAIIVFDIGSSTECITAKGSLYQGARLLEELVNTMCRVIHQGKGSAWSFTGDGLIAHFDLQHFLNDSTAVATSAFRTCHELAQVARTFVQKHREESERFDDLTIRFGMHWGEIFVPTGGSLRFEAFGRDVVVACRACDFVSKTIEPSLPVRERTSCSLGSMTAEFLHHLIPSHSTMNEQGHIHYEGISIKDHGAVPLKGLGKQALYVCTI